MNAKKFFQKFSKVLTMKYKLFPTDQVIYGLIFYSNFEKESSHMQETQDFLFS